MLIRFRFVDIARDSANYTEYRAPLISLFASTFTNLDSAAVVPDELFPLCSRCKLARLVARTNSVLSTTTEAGVSLYDPTLMQLAIRVATRVSELCCSQPSEEGGGEIVNETDGAQGGGREGTADEDREDTDGLSSLRGAENLGGNGGENTEVVRRSGGTTEIDATAGETSRKEPLAMPDSVIMALIVARILDFSTSHLDRKTGNDVTKGSPERNLPVERAQSSGEILEIISEADKFEPRREDPQSSSAGSRNISEADDKFEPRQVEESQNILARQGSISEAGQSSRRRGQASGSVRLVTSWFSPYAHRVAISLREKGVPYVVIEESVLNKNERTLNANPLSKRIPILMHKGKAISESRIIMEYIDEAWPESPSALLPKDPFERSAARYWSDYIDKKIAQTIFQHISVNMKEVYETINDALIGLNKAMTVISHGKAYFMGDRLGFVDIMFAPMIPWFHVLQRLDNYRMPTTYECPRLHQWLNALQSHPSIRPSLEECSPRRLRAFVVQRLRQRKI